ncbi:29003_t:CDS:2, partial [Racocetra persica]
LAILLVESWKHAAETLAVEPRKVAAETLAVEPRDNAAKVKIVVVKTHQDAAEALVVAPQKRAAETLAVEPRDNAAKVKIVVVKTHQDAAEALVVAPQKRAAEIVCVVVQDKYVVGMAPLDMLAFANQTEDTKNTTIGTLSKRRRINNLEDPDESTSNSYKYDFSPDSSGYLDENIDFSNKYITGPSYESAFFSLYESVFNLSINQSQNEISTEHKD